VCGPAHAAAARRLLPRLPKANLIVEPCARNTAPCVGLAALHVARRDPAGVMVMLPADHHVARPAAFREALLVAARVAADGHIATVGLRPSRPETGYGYLEVGDPLSVKWRTRKGLAPRRVARFVEKPDAATAARYLASGDHLWNSGIFAFRADVILEEIRRTMPDLAHQLGEIGAALGTPGYARTLAHAFPACPSVSIDYGVMERSDRIAVVPAEFGWSDVGSFAALPEVRKRDRQGNVAEGEALVFDGKDNVVLAAGGRPLALIGLDGVIAVDAGDAVLVCHKDRAQDVRKAVEELKRRGRDEVL
jgi:mannose-1-phosphate guanylyltransferase